MKIRMVKITPPIKINNHWVYRVDDTVEIDLDGFAEFLCMGTGLDIAGCKTAEGFIEIYINEILRHGSAHWASPKKKDRGKNDIVEDGFGSAWSAYCPECGKKSVQVVRPGKAQCSHCG
jgi:hypothetical protein